MDEMRISIVPIYVSKTIILNNAEAKTSIK